MQYLSVKNLGHYQHYSDRTPPWVKLHRDFLSDYTLRHMPVMSRWLFSCCWILASETGNRIPYDLKYLSERVGQAIKIEHLTPLLEKKLLLASGASSLLASDATSALSSSLLSLNLHPKRKGNGKTAWPDDWTCDEPMQLFARGFGVNGLAEFQRFKDHALQENRRCSNWLAAYRNWIRKAKDLKEAHR